MKQATPKALSLDISTVDTAGSRSLASPKQRIRSSSMPPAKSEFQSVVSEWLQAMGCSCSHPDFSISPLLDSFRNGSLLCELVEKLEKRDVKVQVLPRHDGDIEANFQHALSAVKKSNPPCFNKRYYQLHRELAHGYEDMWAFMWSLFNAYCDVLPQRLASVRPALPYDVLAVSKLETALLEWLRSLGVIGNADFLTELFPAVSSGALLVNTVSAVCHCEIDGTSQQPRSESAALSNIRKALDVLKLTPNMSQKFVWGREKDIQRCDLGVVMGLLEDFYRCAEGLPQRKPGPEYHADGPFLGPPRLPSLGSSIPMTSPLERSEQQTGVFHQRNRVDLATFITDLVPCKRTSFAEDPQPDPYLESWLLQKQFPASVVAALRNGQTDAMTNGVLLCDLVSALERVTLEGVERESASAAAARHNIRLALARLEKKPAFPKALCYVEEQLSQGVPKVWTRLLSAVRKLYPNATGAIRRRRQSCRRLTSVC